jgi:retron-type reverse transcriptase
MTKKHRRLIDQITTTDNLRTAFENTARGKKMTWGFLEFKEYAQANLHLMQEELRDGGYRIGPYREFMVHEPKPRLISALDFKDRLVQHALCNVVAPIFERSLMPQTFACRTGLGTHAGVRYVQGTMRYTKAKYCLKTDYTKFFPSVDREVLHSLIERKIDCAGTLAILREIIPATGKGIPIGSLTSQLFANVYGNMADRFIHFDLGQRHWARYMDDIVVMDDDKERLMDSFLRLSDFSGERMKLHIGRWNLSPAARGVNFLGYRIWATHKLLRKDTVLRAKRKVANFLRHEDHTGLAQFVASWRGHTQWADAHNLNQWMENRYGITL